MIDLTISNEGLKRAIERCRDRNIIIPTFSQLKNPHTCPDKIKDRLRQTGLWDVAPQNLFRITWKNEPIPKGGLFRPTPNYLELPPELTGVEARIIALIGKWFPTGSHKVGASFGDKHVPWIHNVRNTDVVIGIDDNDTTNLLSQVECEALKVNDAFSRKETVRVPQDGPLFSLRVIHVNQENSIPILFQLSDF